MKALRFAVLGVGLLVGSVAAQAQKITVEANIPFAFTVDKTALPAGEYRIESLAASDRVLSIRNVDQDVNALTFSNSCQSPERSAKTKLVFHRFGDRYLLAEVWVRGKDLGHQIPKSKRREELMAERRVPDEIIVAAKTSSSR